MSCIFGRPESANPFKFLHIHQHATMLPSVGAPDKQGKSLGFSSPARQGQLRSAVLPRRLDFVWVSSENQNLPGFMVLTSGGKKFRCGEIHLGFRFPPERLSGSSVPPAGRPGAFPMAKPTRLATTRSSTKSVLTTSKPPLMTLLGFDHKRLTRQLQGLDQRLSNVTKPSRIVTDIFA